MYKNKTSTVEADVFLKSKSAIDNLQLTNNFVN